MSQVRYWQISTNLMDALFGDTGEGTLDLLQRAAAEASRARLERDEFLAYASGAYDRALDEQGDEEVEE